LQVEAHRGKLPDDELAEKIRDAHCVGIRCGEITICIICYFISFIFFSTELFLALTATRVCGGCGCKGAAPS
jgi:hypothetical protein